MPRCQTPDTTGLRAAPTVPIDGADPQRSHGSAGAGAKAATGPLMLVAAYARVSSDRQDREQTIDSQIDALRRAAEQRGWHLAADLICRDDGRTGTTLARPGLDRLRDLVAEGTCAAVLVCSPDRLARNFAHQVLVIDEFRRAGCEVVFLNHAFGDSPEQQRLLQMQGVFAEYERALMLERTRRERLFWARQGRVNWGGTPTYGYRLSARTESLPRQLVVEESEAAVVRQMYRWLVEEQLSSYAISERLRERGVPTSRQGGARLVAEQRDPGPVQLDLQGSGLVQPPPGRRSGPAARQDRVQGSTPGRSVTATPSDRSRNGSRCRCPPSLMPTSGDLAQEQLARNSERATRNNTRHQYLLSALLICGRCGRRMIGVTDGGGRRRYLCSARYPRHAPGACDGRSVTAEPLEDQVWRWIAQLLSDPQLLRAHFEESRGDPAIDGADEREGTRLERQLKTLDREIGRLIDAYQAAAIELDELKERRRQIEDHARHLRQRLDELRRQRGEREQAIRLLEGLEAFCAGIRPPSSIHPLRSSRRFFGWWLTG